MRNTEVTEKEEARTRLFEGTLSYYRTSSAGIVWGILAANFECEMLVCTYFSATQHVDSFNRALSGIKTCQCLLSHATARCVHDLRPDISLFLVRLFVPGYYGREGNHAYSTHG